MKSGFYAATGDMHGAHRGGEDTAAAVPGHSGLLRQHHHILSQGAAVPDASQALILKPTGFAVRRTV